MARFEITLVAVVALSSTALATGDFYEEVIPPLTSYLDRLPSKSFDEVYSDTGGLPPAGKPVDVEKEVVPLVSEIGKTPAEKLLAKVERLLVQARRAQPDTGPMPVNLLHDIRDALASGAKDPKELADYLKFRLNMDAEWPAGSGETPPGASPEELESLAGAASPALRPHYYYLQGALKLRGGDDTESQRWFERVVKEYPKSPRAEAALFMMGRCQISRSRQAYYTQRDPALNEDQRPAVKKLFDSYLRKYPKGRFAGDTIGWLGAYAYDGGDYPGALRLYMEQATIPDHPELVRPALIMAEKSIGHLADDFREPLCKEIARQPRFAMGLVYWLVNTSERDDYDGEFDDPAKVREWRRKILPRLGRAIAKEKAAYAGEKWEPRCLATLALATSGAGDHQSALQLLDSQKEAADATDDGLFARGIIAQRAGDPKQAITALRALATKFPESPLLAGSRLRLALALSDDHQSGAAIVELKRLLESPREEADFTDSSEYPPDRHLAEEEQVRQLIDALWNFAPVEELQPTAADESLDPGLRQQFREVVAQRLLARERFAEAKSYMAPPNWDRYGAPLEKLTLAANAASTPEQKAAACLELGDAWAGFRGKVLTVPLDTDGYRTEVFREGVKADDNRAVNAKALGVKGKPELDLENRDELRHAFNWWLEASDAAPGTPAGATALWRALKAMPTIADVSPFTMDRAGERQWTAVSRKLYDRLRKEAPGSPEARLYAVYWNIPSPVEGYVPYNPDATQADTGGQGAWVSPAEDYPTPGASGARSLDAITADAVKLEEDADSLNWETLRNRVNALRKEASPVYTDLNSAFLINFLDDLHLFTQGSDPGPKVRKEYVSLRVEMMRCSAWFAPSSLQRPAGQPEGTDADEVLGKRITAALSDPAMKPIRDFVAFLELALIANHTVMVPFTGADKDGEPFSYQWRDYPLLAKKSAAFLASYPKSAKREPALLLRARAEFMSAKPGELKLFVNWPEADSWFGETKTLLHERVKFVPEKIQAVLDQYDREFPGGRYAADIRNYRAALFFREHKLEPSLDLTLALLDDDSRPDLQASAADRLEAIFGLLSDEKERMPLMTIIKARPKARQRLDQYLGKAPAPNPLATLRDWLRDQLVR